MARHPRRNHPQQRQHKRQRISVCVVPHGRRTLLLTAWTASSGLPAALEVAAVARSRGRATGHAQGLSRCA
jgi:hypothetical protein